MNTQSSQKLHQLPKDIDKILTSDAKLYTLWKGLTPLAQNEWIYWILSAKKIETKERRIKILTENILDGRKRPCCWAGCVHR